MEKQRQGAHLYFDNNNGTWIRSGKVIGCGFSVRHSEHLKKAGEKRSISRFYLRYPTKGSNRKNSASRKGYFDNLRQYIALGFEINNDEQSKEVANPLEDGGIFSFAETEKKKINALNLRKTSVFV